MLRTLVLRIGLEFRVDGSCRRGFGAWIDEIDPGFVVLVWGREFRVQRVEKARRERAQAAAARAMARHRAEQERGARARRAA